MTYLEHLAEVMGDDGDRKALTFASHYCPSGYGMKDDRRCTAYQPGNCVKCWLQEYDEEAIRNMKLRGGM